ncbi:protein of unknown function [Paenibacillus alvei]|uniref:Uncharacterized protein n=1 Tax=Paenibacillus alvei TaxID=44250 RepID=A0A383RCH2_PAEAL|nr:protein of unknown function [Paenibacillus alvei]
MKILIATSDKSREVLRGADVKKDLTHSLTYGTHIIPLQVNVGMAGLCPPIGTHLIQHQSVDS